MMRFAAILIVFTFGIGLPAASGAVPVSSLEPVAFDALSDIQSFAEEIWKRKGTMLQGIEHSLSFLVTPQADQAYKRLEQSGISRPVVIQSLSRFRVLLEQSSSSEELRTNLIREFKLYRSVGRDGRGTIRFTGYFQPTYQASRVRTPKYRYPIFRLPPDFKKWSKPHPSRVSLEGYDGTGSPISPVTGRELAWLKSRYEAFMIHVQGSAILELTDGTRMAVGYAANTDYRFVGFIKQCLKEKKDRSLSIKQFFLRNPVELNHCLARNNRFIFFRENPTPHPIGSLGVPVIAERSIATDKLQMPPGALGLIQAKIPFLSQDGNMKVQQTTRLVLDQDTGGAIKGPGRVDIFMGTGQVAGQKARSVFSDGELYYLILKDSFQQPVPELHLPDLSRYLGPIRITESQPS